MQVSELDQGADLSASIERGYEVKRMFLVAGISGSRIAKGYIAVNAAGIPRIGDAHPAGIPFVIVTGLSSKPKGIKSENQEVTVTYSIPASSSSQPIDETAQGVLRVGSSLTSKTTFKDVEGNQVILQHDFRDIAPDGSETIRTEFQSVSIEYMVPTVIAQCTRREPKTPLLKSKQFVGWYNKFQIWGELPHRWLCTRIDGDSEDDGRSYTVNYEFQLAEPGETWDPTVVFIDATTGAPPVDQITGQSTLVEGVGKKTVRIYGETDFSILGINFLFGL